MIQSVMVYENQKHGIAMLHIFTVVVASYVRILL